MRWTRRGTWDVGQRTWDVGTSTHGRGSGSGHRGGSKEWLAWCGGEFAWPHNAIRAVERASPTGRGRYCADQGSGLRPNSTLPLLPLHTLDASHPKRSDPSRMRFRGRVCQCPRRQRALTGERAQSARPYSESQYVHRRYDAATSKCVRRATDSSSRSHHADVPPHEAGARGHSAVCTPPSAFPEM